MIFTVVDELNSQVIFLIVIRCKMKFNLKAKKAVIVWKVGIHLKTYYMLCKLINVLKRNTGMVL